MKEKRGDALQVPHIARIVAVTWSVASVALILLFLVGEAFGTAEARTLQAWLLPAFFPFGVLLGLVLAWRWPAAGGAIATAGILAFYAAHRITAGTFPAGPWFALVSAPGPLFLLSRLFWVRSSKTSPHTVTQPRRSEND